MGQLLHVLPYTPVETASLQLLVTLIPGLKDSGNMLRICHIEGTVVLNDKVADPINRPLAYTGGIGDLYESTVRIARYGPGSESPLGNQG